MTRRAALCRAGNGALIKAALADGAPQAAPPNVRYMTRQLVLLKAEIGARARPVVLDGAPVPGKFVRLTTHRLAQRKAVSGAHLLMAAPDGVIALLAVAL